MLLEEFLITGGISQRAFAKRIGWTPAKLNELIAGKRGVTADTALDLAEALHTSAELWLNLQMYWDLARAEARRKQAS
jgi:addiction module HigA family antidote